MENVFRIVRTHLIWMIVLMTALHDTTCQNISASQTSSTLRNSSTFGPVNLAINPGLTRGPNITNIVAVTSTSLKVKWNKQVNALQGKIVKYKICYQVRGPLAVNCSLSKTVLDVNTTMGILTGLNKDTTYDVAVKAATALGYGKLGTVRSHRTFGDGNKPSHYGTHFVLGFMELNVHQKHASNIQISAVPIFDTEVTIQAFGSPPVKNRVLAGDVFHYRPSVSLRMNGTGIQKKGIEVNSTKEIAVTCFNQRDAYAEAYLALPTHALGTTYVAASYKSDGKRSSIGIVAGYPGTTVDIKLNITGSIRYQGSQYGKNRSLTVNLEKLETFHVSHTTDVSGTIITANKPISVITGVMCAKVWSKGRCDQLEEFLLPVEQWGSEYIVASTRNTGDLFRVFAYENQTVVISTYERTVLSAGQFTELDFEGFDLTASIYCSKPCQVVQYLKGFRDPSMIVVPAVSQYFSYYTISFQNESIYQNQSVSLFIERMHKDGLIMNGIPLKDLRWQEVNGIRTTYCNAVVDVFGKESITIFHTLPHVRFGLLVFGSKTYASYGYPGGFLFSSKASTTATTLTRTTQKQFSKVTASPSTKSTTTEPVINASTTATTTMTRTTRETFSEVETAVTLTKTTTGGPLTNSTTTTASSTKTAETTKTTRAPRTIISCPNEHISTSWGIFSWPETKEGLRANLTCPYNSSVLVSRECRRSNKATKKLASWGSFDAKICPSLNKTSLKILELSEKRVNSSNVIAVSRKIANLSSAGKDLISDDVSNMASVLEKIVQVKDTANKVSDDVFSAVDNILDASVDFIVKSQKETKSSTRILKMVNNLLEAINLTETGSYKKTFKNFAVGLSAVNLRSFRGLTFSGVVNQSLMDNNAGKDRGTTADPEETTILLPRTLFNDSADVNISQPQTAVFTLYKETKFFQVNLTEPKESTPRLNSYVIAGSIKSLPVSNLTNPVVLKYASLKTGDKNDVKCVFWSFSQESWSREGCTFKSVEKDGRIICHCNHLTNFAMLMDISPHDETSHEKALGIISYIGCIVSLIGLILTIITILFFKDLRNKVPTQILLNLCIALSLTLIVFLSAAERSKTSSLVTCRAAAIALHYLVLVAFMWTVVEALNMYLAFVKVLPSYIRGFIQKSLVVAWGTPAVVVGVTVAVAHDDYGDTKYCRLRGLPFLISFLAPVIVILVGNTVVFVLVFRSLLKSGSKVTSDRKVKMYQRARQGFSILVVLGLTWLFGVFAINEAKEVFQYLFCIFNSLQGVLIFIFYCLLSSHVKKNYHDFLSKRRRARSRKIGKRSFKLPDDSPRKTSVQMRTLSRGSTEIKLLTLSQSRNSEPELLVHKKTEKA